MPIHKLIAANFKGIDKEQVFDIKPITLFIGPNSSGKSSCIHALGCLAQTVKLNPGSRPIILDDEYAQIHLGRFIEVIHSRSYADSITLGVDIGSINEEVKSLTGSGVLIPKTSSASAKFQYKSTRRTQDIYVSQASYRSGSISQEIKRKPKGNKYELTQKGMTHKMGVALAQGLNFGVSYVRGMKREYFDSLIVLNSIQSKIIRELTRTAYLGPFRQAPQRRYPSRGSSPLEVGPSGEGAVTLLSNEYVQTKKRTHLKKISQWLALMGLAKNIDVARIGRSDLFDVNVSLSDGASLPLADLGYGLSQVLPVLVQCAFAPKESTLLFEQPELHLHHGAAKMLTKIFIETARTHGAHIVAETHSKDLFMQLFQELRDKTITPDEIAIYEVHRDKGASVFKRVNIVEVDGVFEADHVWYSEIDKT